MSADSNNFQIRLKLREEGSQRNQAYANITQLVSDFCHVAFYFAEPSPTHFGYLNKEGNIVTQGNDNLQIRSDRRTLTVLHE